MPIEREFKFVLRLDPALEGKLAASTPFVLDIDQSYLSKGGRIRKKNYRNGNEHGDPNVEYVFTYKHKFNRADRPGVLEIECPISKFDFDLAWEDSTHRIKKTRYVVRGDEGVWEIDFFRHENDTYFAMAELEVDADAGPPSTLHPLVNEYLMFAVPEADDRFTNRKLSSPEWSAELLKEIARDGTATAT